MVSPMRWRDGGLEVLDQTRLPAEEAWLRCETPDEVADAIRRLAVRGAPAIGIAAAYGVALLGSRERVLTHCNTGALATGGRGTALGAIEAAWQAGAVELVWVGETRPLLQGARLTAYELDRAGVPYRLVADASAGSLIARGLVDRVVVGADRIAANGDVANKIGTYPLAVLARRHDVPFHVAAPLS